MYHAQGERKWLSNVGYIFACICGQKSKTLSLDRWPLSIELHAPMKGRDGGLEGG
jgi:hypothetical protein